MKVTMEAFALMLESMRTDMRTDIRNDMRNGIAASIEALREEMNNRFKILTARMDNIVERTANITIIDHSEKSLNQFLEESEYVSSVLHVSCRIKNINCQVITPCNSYITETMEKQESYEEIILQPESVLNIKNDVVEAEAEYEEYEEIIFNSEFTPEVGTEKFNILSENSYLELKTLNSIIPVINYNYYVEQLSLLKLIYYYYDYCYGPTYTESYNKGEIDVTNLIKFIFKRRVFDPGTIYIYYVNWQTSALECRF